MSGYPEGSRDFTKLLSPGVGYGLVVGAGAAFALFMVGLTCIQRRFSRYDPHAATEFATASHSVKPGLICCGIVSAWTWSATLLQSSSATYSDGLSAAWWYGAGGTIQILFFAMAAAKVKQNANGAVTFLEIARARYGWPCHVLFTIYFLACAHIVTGSLVLGCSATINALTGANIIATNFLLPIGIAVYVVAGGLRATFLVDYMHTVILFAVLFFFLFKTYCSSELIGSPGRLWDLLQEAAKIAPVAGNTDGSYTTMKSNSGILFVGCSIATGFAGVFCDQGYWQRAIASRPDTTTKGYMLGGISWFAIPWAFGTFGGLAARALLTNPKFPTYPYALSASQVSAGLPAPAAAATVAGTGGAVAILIIVFMAATSAASAELIAVSSIVTRDIIGVWRPLSGRKMVRASEAVIVGYAVWSGCWSTILHKAHIDLGWLFYVQGVLLTPAVIPVGLTVISRRQSKHAAFWGTLFGTACSLIGWLYGCKRIYGELSITNLALPYSAISGSAPGLVMSGLMSGLITLIKPDNYDWKATRAIALSDSDEPSSGNIEVRPAGDGSDLDEKKDEPSGGGEVLPTLPEVPVETGPTPDEQLPLDIGALQRIFLKATIFSSTTALIIVILIPIPMFAAHYIFSRRFFEVWVGLSIVWTFIAGIFCV
ncbi:hypothetical protein JCM8202v2_000128 [Rhodotorula sphaerocarpa]